MYVSYIFKTIKTFMISLGNYYMLNKALAPLVSDLELSLQLKENVARLILKSLNRIYEGEMVVNFDCIDNGLEKEMTIHTHESIYSIAIAEGNIKYMLCDKEKNIIESKDFTYNTFTELKQITENINF